MVAGGYSPGFLAALDRALAPFPDQRPQSVAAFRQLLGAAPVPSATRGSATDRVRPEIRNSKARGPIAGAALIAVLVVAGAGYLFMRDRGEQSPGSVVDSDAAAKADLNAKQKNRTTTDLGAAG